MNMNMKKILVSAATAGLSASLFAGLYGDTPDAKHAWAVHDWNRPKPAKVEPAKEIGQPPSDAVVLFDGTKASFERNWCDGKGKPSKWSYSPDGYFYTVPGWKNGGGIQTRAKFGDCQLHVEFRHDAADVAKHAGRPQMRGNSGIFLMGNYEIQVLESYATSREMEGKPGYVDNYADGQAGSVYAENPPLVNPARPVGEWQAYDIVFHQPVWDGDRLLHPGSVTVFFNGVLVQDHWEMEGLTTHCRRRPLAPHKTVGPLQLQDHGCVVQYRNVWLRPLASRWANRTHGAMSADEGEVMKLRRETAAKLLAKIDRAKCGAEQVNQALEVLSYSKDEPYLSACRKVCAGYLAKLEAMDDKALDANRDAILSVKRSADVLKRNKVVGDCALCAKVCAIVERKGWGKKK